MGHRDNKELEQQQQQQSGRQVSSNTDTLPKLKVPVFSGDILKWAKFHDAYVASIHHHKRLSKCHKFAIWDTRYEDTIDGLASTNASYDVS